MLEKVVRLNPEQRTTRVKPDPAATEGKRGAKGNPILPTVLSSAKRRDTLCQGSTRKTDARQEWCRKPHFDP